MNRIRNVFVELRREGRGGLIPFIMAGDPDLGATPALVSALASAGADVIELGIPFSDPVADGPAIQRAGTRSLAAGTTLERILAMLRGLDLSGLPPVVLMSYFNPIFRYGEERFVRAAAAAGVSGLIVVDLPVEEAGVLIRAAREESVATIFLAAPNTPPERLDKLARHTTGFLYCVSRLGTTGKRKSVPAELLEWLGSVRARTRVPLAVGFGVSTAAHVRRVLAVADAAVVGSVLVEEVERGGSDVPARLAAALARLRA